MNLYMNKILDQVYELWLEYPELSYKELIAIAIDSYKEKVN